MHLWPGKIDHCPRSRPKSQAEPKQTRPGFKSNPRPKTKGAIILLYHRSPIGHPGVIAKSVQKRIAAQQ